MRKTCSKDDAMKLAIFEEKVGKDGKILQFAEVIAYFCLQWNIGITLLTPNGIKTIFAATTAEPDLAFPLLAESTFFTRVRFLKLCSTDLTQYSKISFARTVFSWITRLIS